MDKKIARYFPILLVICFILDLISVYLVKKPGEIFNNIISIVKIINLSSIATLVFYLDIKKNNSVLGKIGIIGIAVYILLSLIMYFYVKSITAGSNFSLESFKFASDLAKFASVLYTIITCLKNWSIIRLISINTEDNITEITKVGAISLNIINHILLIIATLSNSNTKSWLYIVPTHGEDLLKILIIAFVIYQLLYEEEKEVINIESNNNVDIQSNDFNNFSNMTNTNGPKFINPQLEELNARIENKQVINNSLQNNQTINNTIQNNINQLYTYIQNNQNSQINQNNQNQYNNKI